MSHLRKIPVDLDEAEVSAILSTAELLDRMAQSDRFETWKSRLSKYDRHRFSVAMFRMADLTKKLSHLQFGPP